MNGGSSWIVSSMLMHCFGAAWASVFSIVALKNWHRVRQSVLCRSFILRIRLRGS